MSDQRYWGDPSERRNITKDGETLSNYPQPHSLPYEFQFPFQTFHSAMPNLDTALYSLPTPGLAFNAFASNHGLLPLPSSQHVPPYYRFAQNTGFYGPMVDYSTLGSTENSRGNKPCLNEPPFMQPKEQETNNYCSDTNTIRTSTSNYTQATVASSRLTDSTNHSRKLLLPNTSPSSNSTPPLSSPNSTIVSYLPTAATPESSTTSFNTYYENTSAQQTQNLPNLTNTNNINASTLNNINNISTLEHIPDDEFYSSDAEDESSFHPFTLLEHNVLLQVVNTLSATENNSNNNNNNNETSQTGLTGQKRKLDEFSSVWQICAQHLPGRTPHECFDHYSTFQNFVSFSRSNSTSTANNSDITKNELTSSTQQFYSIFEKTFIKPLEKSKASNKKNKLSDCSEKSEKLRKHWSFKECQTLKSFVDENGLGNWSELSKILPGRNASQCREKWETCFDPKRTKTQWTSQEIEIIKSEQKKIGNKWAVIAKKLKGRTRLDVKNFWYANFKNIHN